MKWASAAFGGAITVAAVAGLARAALLVIKVSGDSMTPTYQSGDSVLAARRWIAGPTREGDVVICRLPAHVPGPSGYLVKRVTSVTAGQVDVRGDGERSYDSRTFGSIPQACVHGRVITRLTLAKRGRVLRSPARTA
jgi:phage repressor protein C with HTH and peptisase S24 domain